MDEPIFTDDPATMDLGAKVAAAWTDFQAALADTLAKMPETVAGLDITLDPSAAGHGAPLYSVSIDLGDAQQLRAYAVSNRMLPREHHISRKRIGEVVALAALTASVTVVTG